MSSPPDSLANTNASAAAATAEEVEVGGAMGATATAAALALDRTASSVAAGTLNASDNDSNNNSTSNNSTSLAMSQSLSRSRSMRGATAGSAAAAAAGGSGGSINNPPATSTNNTNSTSTSSSAMSAHAKVLGPLRSNIGLGSVVLHIGSRTVKVGVVGASQVAAVVPTPPRLQQLMLCPLSARPQTVVLSSSSSSTTTVSTAAAVSDDQQASAPQTPLLGEAAAAGKGEGEEGKGEDQNDNTTTNVTPPATTTDADVVTDSNTAKKEQEREQQLLLARQQVQRRHVSGLPTGVPSSHHHQRSADDAPTMEGELVALLNTLSTRTGLPLLGGLQKTPIILVDNNAFTSGSGAAAIGGLLEATLAQLLAPRLRLLNTSSVNTTTAGTGATGGSVAPSQSQQQPSLGPSTSSVSLSRGRSLRGAASMRSLRNGAAGGGGDGDNTGSNGNGGLSSSADPRVPGAFSVNNYAATHVDVVLANNPPRGALGAGASDVSGLEGHLYYNHTTATIPNNNSNNNTNSSNNSKSNGASVSVFSSSSAVASSSGSRNPLDACISGAPIAAATAPMAPNQALTLVGGPHPRFMHACTTGSLHLINPAILAPPAIIMGSNNTTSGTGVGSGGGGVGPLSYPEESGAAGAGAAGAGAGAGGALIPSSTSISACMSAYPSMANMNMNAANANAANGSSASLSRISASATRALHANPSGSDGTMRVLTTQHHATNHYINRNVTVVGGGAGGSGVGVGSGGSGGGGGAPLIASLSTSNAGSPIQQRTVSFSIAGGGGGGAGAALMMDGSVTIGGGGATVSGGLSSAAADPVAAGYRYHTTTSTLPILGASTAAGATVGAFPVPSFPPHATTTTTTTSTTVAGTAAAAAAAGNVSTATKEEGEKEQHEGGSSETAKTLPTPPPPPPPPRTVASTSAAVRVAVPIVPTAHGVILKKPTNALLPAPAVVRLSSAACALAGSFGRRSGLVIDLGYAGVQVTAVIHNIALLSAAFGGSSSGCSGRSLMDDDYYSTQSSSPTSQPPLVAGPLPSLCAAVKGSNASSSSSSSSSSSPLGLRAVLSALRFQIFRDNYSVIKAQGLANLLCALQDTSGYYTYSGASSSSSGGNTSSKDNSNTTNATRTSTKTATAGLSSTTAASSASSAIATTTTTTTTVATTVAMPCLDIVEAVKNSAGNGYDFIIRSVPVGSVPPTLLTDDVLLDLLLRYGAAAPPPGHPARGAFISTSSLSSSSNLGSTNNGSACVVVPKRYPVVVKTVALLAQPSVALEALFTGSGVLAPPATPAAAAASLAASSGGSGASFGGAATAAAAGPNPFHVGALLADMEAVAGQQQRRPTRAIFDTIVSAGGSEARKSNNTNTNSNSPTNIPSQQYVGYIPGLLRPVLATLLQQCNPLYQQPALVLGAVVCVGALASTPNVVPRIAHLLATVANHEMLSIQAVGEIAAAASGGEAENGNVLVAVLAAVMIATAAEEEEGPKKDKANSKDAAEASSTRNKTIRFTPRPEILRAALSLLEIAATATAAAVAAVIAAIAKKSTAYWADFNTTSSAIRTAFAQILHLGVLPSGSTTTTATTPVGTSSSSALVLLRPSVLAMLGLGPPLIEATMDAYDDDIGAFHNRHHNKTNENNANGEKDPRNLQYGQRRSVAACASNGDNEHTTSVAFGWRHVTEDTLQRAFFSTPTTTPSAAPMTRKRSVDTVVMWGGPWLRTRIAEGYLQRCLVAAQTQVIMAPSTGPSANASSPICGAGRALPSLAPILGAMGTLL